MMICQTFSCVYAPQIIGSDFGKQGFVNSFENFSDINAYFCSFLQIRPKPLDEFLSMLYNRVICYNKR